METPIAEIFQDEYQWMQRETKGLYPWAARNNWEFLERITGGCCDHPFCRRSSNNGHSLISQLLSSQVQTNPLLDVFQKALIRAEIRFISRFILQRSNEERLTGNLVSELDAAIFLAQPAFKQLSRDRYHQANEIDFYYYDLSRGGKVEKDTGADLGFIVVVDLPDYPFTVKTIIFQAKKCDSRASIDIPQLRTLLKTSETSSAFLFYDMNFRSLASPIVIEAKKLKSKAEESEKNGAKSFSLPYDDILNSGIPLSLYLLHDVIERDHGAKHSSFDSAFREFRELTMNKNLLEPFNGRVAIVSVGKKISLTTNNDGGLEVAI